MSDNIRYTAGHRMHVIKISQVVHFIGLKILNAAAVTRDKAMLKIDISVQILAFGMTLFKINIAKNSAINAVKISCQLVML